MSEDRIVTVSAPERYGPEREIEGVSGVSGVSGGEAPSSSPPPEAPTVEQTLTAEFGESSIRYSASDTDLLLTLTPKKTRWLVTASWQRTGALLGRSVIDLDAAGQRETFLKSLRLGEGETEPVRRMLLSIAIRLADDAAAWARWMWEQQVEQQAEAVAAAQERRAEEAAKAFDTGRPVLEDPGLLYKVGSVAERLGLAGEARNVRSLYLEITTRICDEVVNITVKGASSAGKSHLVKKLLRLFPESAYWEMSGMSPKALVYTERDFAHTYVIIYEYVGSEDADYFIRTLQSEGCIKYAFVDTSGGRPVTLEIEKEGPTGFITTTTLPVLHDENETRMWSVTIDETEAQTRRVSQAVADRFNSRGPEPDLSPWVAAQTWLQTAGANEAFIEYSHWLADRMPTRPIRVRRDIGRVLQVIQASAILHQAQRQRAEDGRIIADVRDYRNAYVLCGEEFRTAQRPIPSRTAAILEQVQAIYDETCKLAANRGKSTDDVRVTYADLIQRTHLSKQRLSNLLQPAFDAGVLENDAGKGKPARMLPRMDLFVETTALPDPEDLAADFPHLAGGCWVHPLTGAEEDTSPPTPRNGRYTRYGPESSFATVSDEERYTPDTPPESPIEPPPEPALPTEEPPEQAARLPSVATPSSIAYITEPSALRDVLPELMAAPVLGFDIETTGLDPHSDRVRLIQLATPERVVLVDCFRVDPQPLQPLFEGEDGPLLVSHNQKFELSMLAAAGLPIPPGCRLFDTQLAAKLLLAGDREFYTCSLAEAVARWLGQTLSKEEQRSDWTGELREAQLAYAATDAAVLLPLRERLEEALAEADLDRVAELEMRALPSIVWLEQTGAPFDVDAWRALSYRAVEEQVLVEQELTRLLGEVDLFGRGTINWGSSAQVKKLLNQRGHQVTRTNEATLLALPETECLVYPLLHYRAATNRVNAFGIEFQRHVHPVTGRIHADWLQLGTVAGRMSCNDPNLQQIPRDPRYRACFRAPEGRVLVKADYSQIELRIAAEMSGDARMLEAYERGEDLHLLTAAAVLGRENGTVRPEDRQAAKAANFGLIYGSGPARFRETAWNEYRVEMTMDQATTFKRKFFDTYHGLKSWHARQGGQDRPIETRTVAGRRRRDVVKYTEKINTPVQGTGADGLKHALALLWETRDRCPETAPVLVVHDEIVVECPEDRAEQAREWLVDCMTRGMAEYLKQVPVVVEATIERDWSGK